MYLDTTSKILIIVIILFLIFYYIIPSSNNNTDCSLYEHIAILDELDASFSNEALQAIAAVYDAGSAGFSNLNVSNQVTAKDVTSTALTSSTITTNTLTSSGSAVNATKPVNIKAGLNVIDKLCAGNVCISANNLADMINDYSLKNRVYSNRQNDYVIYENIFNAFNDGTLLKYGTPRNYNDTGNRERDWNGRVMINIGTSPDGSGGWRVRVPAGMSVIWIRCLNERRCVVGIGGIRFHGCGWRNKACVTPNGDFDIGQPMRGSTNLHRWFPIALPQGSGGKTFNLFGANTRSNDPWINGIAFSTNFWNHASFPAVTYENAPNGGTAIGFSTNYGNDAVAVINRGQTVNIPVPVIDSGKDKLMYFIMAYDRNTNRHAAALTVRLNVGGQ